MIMAWRDRLGLLYIVLGNNGRVVDKKERWGMQMRRILRIRADMRDQGQLLPNSMGNGSH